jgi:hypothetical protein
MAAEPTFPLVAVVSSYPLLAEAVEGALEGIAEVRAFPAGQGDTADFLRLLQPAAVVVDSAEEAEAAAEFARFARIVFVCCTPVAGRTFPTARLHRSGSAAQLQPGST